MKQVSSFLVFSLGILLLVVSLYTLGKRLFDSPNRPAQTALEIPTSDLPALYLNTTEEFHRQLDKVYDAGGGLDSVRNYVVQEFVPGRKIVLRSNFAGEPDREFIIVDRELRRCNADGGALLEKAPIAPRLGASQQATERATLQNWTRTNHQFPFFLTVWSLPVR